MHYVTNKLKHLLKWLNPDHHCLLCDARHPQRICDICTHYFARAPHSCQTCGLPLHHSALFCGECLQQPPVYDHVFSPYLYQAPLNKLINDYKHKGHEFVGKALSDLFCEQVTYHYQQQHKPLPQLIAPVPLHWWRQWQRGFNQTTLFSEDLSTHLKLSLFSHIKRKRLRKHQQGLSRQQRLNNLADCFQVLRPLKGEHVAIVDDVMTTGATVNAMAKSLKAAGAGTITVWALARTPLKTS